MKKILLATVLSCTAFAGHSQSFYIRGGMGYAWPVGGEGLLSYQSYSGIVTAGSYNIQRGSLSAGMQAYVGGGYQINKNFGLEIDVNTIPIPAWLDEVSYSASTSGSGSFFKTQTSERAKWPIYVTPSVVFQTGGKKWQVYSRLGICLPVRTVFSAAHTASNGYGDIAEHWEIKNRFSPGFASALGVQRKAGKKLNLWAEVSVLSMSLFDKEGTRLDLISNGYPANGSGATVTYNMTGPTSYSNSSAPATLQSFNNLGVSVGIRQDLGGGAKKQPTVPQ